MPITKQQARDLILSTNGRIFSVCFKKRSTGVERRMTARTGVTKWLKGGELPYDPKDYNLLVVCDLDVVQMLPTLSPTQTMPVYRMIPWDAITEVCVCGRREIVI